MQHTHTREAPLSADAILDSYLAQQVQQQQQQQRRNLTTLKRNVSLSTGQTASKQVPLLSGLISGRSPAAQKEATLKQAINSASHQMAKSKMKRSPLPYYLESERASYHSHLVTDDDDNDDDSPTANNCLETNNTSSGLDNTTTLVTVQRKLLAFFYIYATIIITLYLTYAIYCYHQQSVLKRQQQQIFESTTSTPQAASASEPLLNSAAMLESNSNSEPAAAAAATSLHESPTAKHALDALQAKMDDKLRLLERYIDVLALDLKDTKARLREREKCACSIGCTHNGTRYTDGQRWHSADPKFKCDICTCRAGRISCAPRECPKLASNCDSVVQLPGQCCPTCMKKCKLNQTLVAHGHTFMPSAKGAAGKPTKQCKCYDGLIKCEPIVQAQQNPGKQQQASASSAAAKNKTIEYLSSILGPQQIRVAAAEAAMAAGNSGKL